MDKSRQQFEEWFNENGISTGWCSKRDLEFIKTKMFSCWQASREKLEIELPEFRSRSNDMYYDGFHSCLDDIREELISNGVKIKNE